MDYLMTAVQDNDGGRLRQLIRNRKKARASQDPSKQRDRSDFLQNACEAAAGSNCIAALEVILDEGGRIEAGEIALSRCCTICAQKPKTDRSPT